MTAARGITAFALVYVLGLSEGLWAVIAAIVVTQSSVGGSLKAAFDQLVGSLFGAVYGTTIAVVVSPDDPLSSIGALVVALAPLSILAAFPMGFRIAPITAAIMLLGGSGFGVGPLGLAAHRIIGVSLGCVVGLLVSVFVVPAQASRSVLTTSSQVAHLMAQQLEALGSGSNTGRTNFASLAVRTRKALSRLETLVEEAAHERRSWLTDAPDGEPLLRTMRRLRHDVGMLRRAAREAGQAALHEHVAKHWLCAAQTGAATLRRVGQVLAGLNKRQMIATP